MTRVTPRPKEVVLLILGGNDLKKLLGNEKTEAITASLTAELTELERCEVKPMICLCTLCYNFETYFFPLDCYFSFAGQQQ